MSTTNPTTPAKKARAFKTHKTPAKAVSGAPAPMIEALAGPQAPKGKLGTLVALLSRPEGATVYDLAAATNWQVHSVRGAMAGALKKKAGFTIISEKTEAGRIYRIAAEAAA
jgi:hypothetical protein